MAIPKQGDRAVRTSDGQTFTVREIVKAGGEEVYKIEPESGGGEVEVTGASFIKEHDQDRADFEIV